MAGGESDDAPADDHLVERQQARAGILEIGERVDDADVDGIAVELERTRGGRHRVLVVVLVRLSIDITPTVSVLWAPVTPAK